MNDSLDQLLDESEDIFTNICDVDLSRHQAKEVLKSLAVVLFNSIEEEKYNVAYNIVMQDSKFIDLLNKFNEDFETNQIKSFVESVNNKPPKE